MKTIAFDDQQYKALVAIDRGSTSPRNRDALRSLLRTAGWRDPADVPAQYHSSTTHVVQVLALVPGAGPGPVMAYYVQALDEWRVVGSPSRWFVRGWMPLPSVPAPDTLPWEV